LNAYVDDHPLKSRAVEVATALQYSPRDVPLNAKSLSSP